VLADADYTRIRGDAIRARARVDEERDRLQKAREDLVRQQTELERLDKVAGDVERHLAANAKDQALLDVAKILERAYGRDGIPALIVSQAAVPAIELEASRILAELGTGYRVELRTEKALASGATADALDVVIVTETGERPYETFSGGERTRLNLALRIGLARLLAARRGAESRLLAIDEPEYLDQAGTAALVSVLRGLTGDFDKVYLISHVPDLRDAFDATLEVSKNGAGLSQIGG
jgi:DNA repair protein SbcC/Rad50